MTSPQPATARLWPDSSLALHRCEFAALDGRIYANFGARGVMARSSIAAMTETAELLQSVGPGSRIATSLAVRETLALRRSIGRLVGAEPARVALVENVSQACAAAIWGIDWRPGERCLIGLREPPGTWMAAHLAAARFGFEIDLFDPGADDVTDWRRRLAEALHPATRLVVLSHVDWVTGAVLPVRDLVEAVRSGPAGEAAIALDGAQAAGAMPVDLSDTKIDLYAIAGQKWLGGADGSAAMVLADPVHGRIRPSLVGWRAVVSSDDETIRLSPDAARFETGSVSLTSIASLREALRVADAFAPMPERAARIAASTARLRQGLDGIGCGVRLVGHGQQGLVSVMIEGVSAIEATHRLELNGVIVKAHAHPACVRLCVHYLTLDQEVDAMIEAVGDLCAREPPRVS